MRVKIAKEALVFATILCFSMEQVVSQTHISVPLNDPVYQLLYSAEAGGILPNLPMNRPYSRQHILKLLELLKQSRGELTTREQQSVLASIERLSTPKTGWQYGSIASSGSFGTFQGGVELSLDYRANFNNLESWHAYNGLLAYFSGDIGRYLSYRAAAGISYNKIAPDLFYTHYTQESGVEGSTYYIHDGMVQFYTGEYGGFSPPGGFAPYHYTPVTVGHHFSFSDKAHHDGVTRGFSLGVNLEDEISLSLYDGGLMVRTGRFDREWGKGWGSLYLSGSSHPFPGVELAITPVKWFRFAWLVGSLGDWFIDSYINRVLGAPQRSEQKMLTLQQIEVVPTDWFSLHFSSGAIWGKRFELAYLFPGLVPFISQGLNGDLDNVNLTIGANFRIPYVGTLYGSLFIDEAVWGDWGRIFTNPRNIFAYQGGLRIPIPVAGFSTVSIQYTKLEPFVYAHYGESNSPNSDLEVSMAYTGGGANLGYFLPPNSDELLVRFDAVPWAGLRVTAQYQLIRHGTNDYYPGGTATPEIYGDINIPFDYSQHSDYPEKSFLNDGVYDWSNIATLSAEYRLPDYPLSIELSYIFSHTHWKTNDWLVETPEPVISNILGLSVTVFR